jgi:hypothetical protein
MNHCNVPHTGVLDSETSSHNGICNNGIQGRFGPGVKGGLQPLDTGHYLGIGEGKGTGGVLAGHVHVAHVPGQAPETFPAQALHVASGPSRLQDLAVGHASALDSYGAIGCGDVQLIHTAFAASSTPSLSTLGTVPGTAPLPDHSGRAARLQEALWDSGQGGELQPGGRHGLSGRNLEDPPEGHPILAEEVLNRHPLAAFEVAPGGPQHGM